MVEASSEKLGILGRVDLRNAWETEDRDFTPWLAEEQNLKILSDAISLDLELEAVEKNVGPFRADILCKDIQNDCWVLIENQLEKTDHKHLGQLLTYAAGLQAATIIWIADKFSDEHRAAMDWLNKITAEEFKFFGLEIELWKIDNSLPAPKFNIVVKPNDWSRSVSTASNRIASDADSPIKQTQLEYWTYLKTYLGEHESFIKSQTPTPQHWLTFTIGKAGFHLSTTIHSRENRMGVELFISGERAKDYFYLLYQNKDAIENKIGQPLEWMELPNKKGSRIVCFKKANFDNKEIWDQDMAWFKEMLEKFDTTFRPLVRQLDLTETQIETEMEEAE